MGFTTAKGYAVKFRRVNQLEVILSGHFKVFVKPGRHPGNHEFSVDTLQSDNSFV